MTSEDVLLKSQKQIINFYCRRCGSHALNQCVTLGMQPEMYFMCSRCGARFKLTKGLVYDALIRDRLNTQYMMDIRNRIVLEEDCA